MSLSKCIGCAHYKRTPMTVVNGYANGFETYCALGREEFFNINGCDWYCMRIEYIPKNAIPYKEINVTERNHGDVCDETITVAYKEDIDRFPAADVERVRHGRWQWSRDEKWSGGGKTTCSLCGYGFADGAYHEVYEFKYCPMCGAKMDAPDVVTAEEVGE